MADSPMDGAIDAIADGETAEWPISANRPAPETTAVGVLRALAAAAPRPPRRERPVARARQLTLVSLVSRAAIGLALAHVAAALFGLAIGHIGARQVPVAATLVGFLGFGLCACWLFVAGAGDPRARALGASYLAIAASFCGRFIPPGYWFDLPLRALSPAPFMPLFLWAFVAEFPRTQRPSRYDGLCRWGVRVSLVMGVLLLVTTALDTYEAALIPRALVRAIETGNLYWAAIFILQIPALAVIHGKSRLAAPAERQRGRMFSLVSVFVMLTVAVEILAEIFIAPFFHFMREHRVAMTPAFFGILMLHPVVTTYAVLVDRVLDVATTVSRGARYLLARHVLVGLSAAPLVLLIAFLYVHRRETIGAALSEGVGLTLLSLAVAGATLTVFRDHVVRYLDARFDRTPTDLAVETAALTASIGNARTADEASEVVEHGLARCLAVPRVRVYRMGASRASFAATHGRGLPITDRSALFALLCASRAPVVLDGSPFDVRDLLPPDDVHWCDRSDAALLVPVLGAADTPLGALMLGAKTNGDSFLRTELAFVAAVASALALKLEGFTPAVGQPLQDQDDEPALTCDRCGRVAPASASACACGGRSQPASVPALLGGKFRTTAYIGAGAMGVVYRALDTTLNRPVALKTLGRLSGEAADRLAGEARMMAAVAHPNLATIYSVERWRRTPILVLEFLEHGSLASRLTQPMAVDEALRLGVLLAAALEQLHGAHILHRDIKPTNIGFTRDEAPKLLDFGLARFLGAADPDAPRPVPDKIEPPPDASQTQALWLGEVPLAGTPLYLPPEALTGAPPSPGFDLWALALVLFEAVAGQHPFAADTVPDVLERISSTGPLDMDRFRPDCPPAVTAGFRQLLHPDPATRHGSAAEFRTALEHLLVYRSNQSAVPTRTT